jgi:hypothetical protein
MEISGHKIKIQKDNTVKKERHYCVLGISRTKVIFGGSADIVYRKCQRAIKKGEVSFEPFPVKENKDEDKDTIPF